MNRYGTSKVFGLRARKVSDLADYMWNHREEYDVTIMSHVLEQIERPPIVPFIALIKEMLKVGDNS